LCTDSTDLLQTASCTHLGIDGYSAGHRFVHFYTSPKVINICTNAYHLTLFWFSSVHFVLLTLSLSCVSIRCDLFPKCNQNRMCAFVISTPHPEFLKYVYDILCCVFIHTVCTYMDATPRFFLPCSGAHKLQARRAVLYHVLSYRLVERADPSGCAVFCRAFAGIVGSNPTRGMDVCLLRSVCVVR
jgi:hypothetical protein